MTKSYLQRKTFIFLHIQVTRKTNRNKLPASSLREGTGVPRGINSLFLLDGSAKPIHSGQHHFRGWGLTLHVKKTLNITFFFLCFLIVGARDPATASC